MSAGQSPVTSSYAQRARRRRASSVCGEHARRQTSSTAMSVATGHRTLSNARRNYCTPAPPVPSSSAPPSSPPPAPHTPGAPTLTPLSASSSAGTSLPTSFFFLFIHYSRATYGDHGEIMYSPVPVRCPRGGGTLLAPLAPRAGLSQVEAHQRNRNGENERKNNKERTKEITPSPIPRLRTP